VLAPPSESKKRVVIYASHDAEYLILEHLEGRQVEAR
jgi:hypothetical protein